MAAVVVRKRSGMPPVVDPNVIPFIDVLLVLLIIFMVTAPKPTTDLRIDMPRPGVTRPMALPPTIVAIRQTGDAVQIFVDNEQVDAADLPQRTLAHLQTANPSLTADDALASAHIFVRADLDVSYQRVVSVVDALQQARFDHVAIAAQQA
ncbi:MAG: biopolymer transporter ExbD [Proteobacteria bacterium]|nr:biopolymer transporter ExbD [Pseudomonadota bacterium]